MAIPLDTLRAQARSAGARPLPMAPPRKPLQFKWVVAAIALVAGLLAHQQVRRPATVAAPVVASPTVPSMERLAAAIEPNVLQVLQSSRNAATDDTVSAMLTGSPRGMRSWDFLSVPRDPSKATPHRDAAYCAFRRGDFNAAVAQQKAAVESDPLDPRLAGDLAIYLLRLRRHDEAYRTVLTALALRCAAAPGAAGPSDASGVDSAPIACAAPSGRTADWETLAAVLALQGQVEDASSALRVARATVKDDERRTRSTYCANRYTYAGLLTAAQQAVHGDLATAYAWREGTVCEGIRALTVKRCGNVASPLVPAP